MGPLTILLTMLATARITRLITTDRVTDGIRERIMSRMGADSRTGYLIHCDWCVSVYVGIGAAYSAWAWSDQTWFRIATLALSASYAAGYLASRED